MSGFKKYHRAYGVYGIYIEDGKSTLVLKINAENLSNGKH